ncbi:penicillin-binding protein [Lactobacillus selangorensis]
MMKSKNAHSNRQRTGIAVLAVMVAVFLVFVFRFSYLVVGGSADHVNLTERSKQKYTDDSTILARRGTIYDAIGNPIAEDANAYSIYAVIDKDYVSTTNKPLYVTNKKKVARVLSQYLSLSQKKILAYLNPKNKNAFQVEFGSAGQNLTLDIKNAITAHHLKGIYFTNTPSRLYPNGIFASHLIGQVSSSTKSSGKLVGTMGLEKQYNTVLAGKNGYKKSQVDSYGYKLDNRPSKTVKAKDGSNIYLTIDSRLQSYLESLMSKVNRKYQPASMNAILIDPKTGKILAATQRPTFNAQTQAGLGTVWRDTLVEDAYEPGSVMKVFSLSAAINSGKYHPNDYYQSGSVEIDGTKVNDWDTAGWGTIPISQAFTRSSNVGFVKIEQGMGKATWKEYLKKFGFLKKTNIGLPGEVSGSIQYKQPLDQALTAFGQGVDVSAMQMVQGLTAIGNGGKMMKPQIVSKIVNPNTGKTTTYKPQEVSQPITKKTASKVLSAMEDVVYKSYGTGSVYKIPGYKVAVKTGTAQIANPKGGYLTGDSNYIFSVAGMAPAKNPKYILYITMKQPGNMSEAAEKILSEVFNPMMKRALSSSDDSDATTDSTSEPITSMPSVTGKSVTSVQTTMQKQDLTTTTIGTGNRVVQQLPRAGEQLTSSSHIYLLTNGAMTMPDMKGWSKADVRELGTLTGVKFKFSGSGTVAKQSLAPKSVLNSKETITVTLKE